ncbi:MAG: ComF family protein [Anaerolineales bacterium]|nr:ComF family protein [Anaerolineales bacterium]
MGARIMRRRFPRLEENDRSLQSFLLDLFFPPQCVYCRSLGPRICAACAAGIDWIDSRRCPWCGLPEPIPPTHRCIDRTRLDFVRSAAAFSGPLRKALHALKYDADRSLAAELVKLAYPHWSPPSWEFDLILPVPLGKRRQIQRGYNQSLLLAGAIARRSVIPLGEKNLVRVRETQSQVGLSLGERRENVAEAFRAAEVAGRRILLVDDVCTTGATLDSCAAALRKAGAAAVAALTLARAVLPAAGRES